MNNAKINNEINLTYPDSFKEMGEEELAKYFGTPADRWGVYDADRHIILSVNWTKAGFMQSDPDMFLHKIEAKLRLDLLNYQRHNAYKTKIGGKKAVGIRFEYRVDDMALVQLADIVAFKYKKNFYTIYHVTRKKTASGVLPDFQEVLKSVTLS